MTPMDVSVEVARPADEVFAFVSDFENNPTWQSGVESATYTTDGPLEVGSQYVQVARFLGWRVESAFEVTAFEPGRLVRIESTGGTFPIQVTRRVDPTPGGARVTATVEGQPGGVLGLFAPITDRLARRRIQADYRTLRRHLEATDDADADADADTTDA